MAAEEKPNPLRVAISGAAGAIGAATARVFAARGASLVLIDRDEAALSGLRHALGEAVAQVVVCDQAAGEETARALREIGVVDVFVNNAGVLLRKPLLETDDDDIAHVLNVNVVGATRMAIGMARAMRAAGRPGVILNVSSHQAFVGGMGRGIYSMSKAALVQFTRTAGAEWAPHGIRVIGLAPGPVGSPLMDDVMADPARREAVLSRLPLGRLMTQEEIAGLIHEMCSGRMACVIGQTLIADGGAMLS
ncbi:dehydrogenase [Azorhizobium oxalatiphilum]|uniref:Dehydrogenase n=1 Tax=Azorhizobium oxalatiphilum TaxID=980631 RepID=A0A917FJQ2_9HYPH|nr:SDR family oxidoreductase [Azorhizobium oxalatiphilum]GGF86709.1 dehydrogenase [Azorhizobium oxalatiphilum]